MTDIAVVGNVSMDRVGSSGNLVDAQGGAAVYTAISSSLLNGDTCLVGRIGRDFRLDYLRTLRRIGIDLSGLRIIPGGRSTRFTIEHDAFKATYCDYEINVGNSLCLDDIPTHGRNARIIHLCPNSPRLQERFIEDLATGSAAVSLDSISAEIFREHYVFINRVFSKADFYFPNREEAVMLYRYLKDGKLMSVPEAKEAAGALTSRKLVRIADHLQRFFKGVLCLKCDERGVVVADDEVIWEIPSYEVTDVTDPTGAGDTFAGAFLATYAQEQDVYYAAVNGCAAASFVIQGNGIDNMLTTSHEEIMEVAETIGEGRKWT